MVATKRERKKKIQSITRNQPHAVSAPLFFLLSLQANHCFGCLLCRPKKKKKKKQTNQRVCQKQDTAVSFERLQKLSLEKMPPTFHSMARLSHPFLFPRSFGFSENNVGPNHDRLKIMFVTL
jgi:hypothetical protein